MVLIREIFLQARSGPPNGGKEFEDIMKDYHDFVESGRREIYTIEA